MSHDFSKFYSCRPSSERCRRRWCGHTQLMWPTFYLYSFWTGRPICRWRRPPQSEVRVRQSNRRLKRTIQRSWPPETNSRTLHHLFGYISVRFITRRIQLKSTNDICDCLCQCVCHQSRAVWTVRSYRTNQEPQGNHGGCTIQFHRPFLVSRSCQRTASSWEAKRKWKSLIRWANVRRRVRRKRSFQKQANCWFVPGSNRSM